MFGKTAFYFWSKGWPLSSQGLLIDSMDFVKVLPTEITLKIFENTDVKSLCLASQACRSWRNFINHCDLLWKIKCKTFDQNDVAKDAKEGLRWRAILIRNYGANGVRRRWEKGLFSCPKSYEELPGDHLCPMSAEVWGNILEIEMNRGKISKRELWSPVISASCAGWSRKSQLHFYCHWSCS